MTINECNFVVSEYDINGDGRALARGWQDGVILGLLKVKTFSIWVRHHLVVPLVSIITDASNRIARW